MKKKTLINIDKIFIIKQISFFYYKYFIIHNIRGFGAHGCALGEFERDMSCSLSGAAAVESK